jgi:hypothetical protein
LAKVIPKVAATAAPQPKGRAIPSFDSAEQLGRMDRLEADNSHIRKVLDFVQGTNTLVVIVLFVGFAALLFSLFALMVETFKSTPDPASTQVIQGLQHIEDQQQTMQQQIDALRQGQSSSNSTKQ